MTSNEIRARFLRFFEKRGHTIIPSSSLVTSDEKGVTNPTLFNTAGMQPLVPYLLGKPYLVDGKEVKRLADAQKCLRTIDIDDVGDKTHATFFEMLGNWSLGDYFKKEAISWSYEFLTSKEEGLGLDPRRLYVTVFEGDENASKDEEAAEIWRGVFKIPRPSADHLGAPPFSKGESAQSSVDNLPDRIFFMPASSNWWEAGENGPCGPDTEMYYDIANRFGGRGITKEEFIDADSKRELVEVWNDVFMQYEKKDGKIIGKLPKPSVDTGAGLERLAMTMQGVNNIYETDLLKPVMEVLSGEFGKVTENLSLSENRERDMRIVADHVRAAVFLIADGVRPSNTDRGYVLRRLLRRAIRLAGIFSVDASELVPPIAETYKDSYPALKENANVIKDEIRKEAGQFHESMQKALKSIDLHEFDESDNSGKLLKSGDPTGKDLFLLFTSHGLPPENAIEYFKTKERMLIESGYLTESHQDEFWHKILCDFNDEFKKHKALSRAGAEKKFKGGLADANDEMVVKYHTATHLLHQALHDVLGDGVMQKGSNITAERLRFDFAHGAKMTEEEKRKVEEIVNRKIAEELSVNQIVMPREEAEKTGARHFFGEKYGDQVSIYFIGQASNPPVVADLKNAYSKEFCGGPHVKNTSELKGTFKIKKEEAVAQGVRRIKAVLE